MKIPLSILTLFLSVTLSAQNDDILSKIVFLCSASSIEDVDEDIIEHFESLHSHPLPLNTAPVNRLRSSGLFSQYQTASILDYISENGPIMSIGELALVNGIGEMYAQALAPFICFDAELLQASGRYFIDFQTQNQFKVQNQENKWTDAIKIKTGSQDRFSISIAAKKTYDEDFNSENLKSVSLDYNGSRIIRKLVIGDYNARFGQGLAMWNGFSLTGFSSAKSFYKNPTGISPSSTYSSSSHKGLAVQTGSSKWLLHTMIDFKTKSSNGLPLGCMNLTVLYRNGQTGFTILSEGIVSTDFRWNFGKVDCFTEVLMNKNDEGHDICTSALAGLCFNPSYGLSISTALRSYPKGINSPYASPIRSRSKLQDEKGISLGMDYNKLIMTLDYAEHKAENTKQFKTLLKWSPDITERLHLENRFVLRYRSQDIFRVKSDLSTAIKYSFPKSMYFKVHSSLSHAEDTGRALYFEAAQAPESGFKLFFRYTVFSVNNWNDRIYIYERDIPGAFSVPALYGEGESYSLKTSLKWRHFSISARLSYRSYYKKKPGIAELKTYLSYSF